MKEESEVYFTDSDGKVGSLTIPINAMKEYRGADDKFSLIGPREACNYKVTDAFRGGIRRCAATAIYRGEHRGFETNYLCEKHMNEVNDKRVGK